MTCQEKENSALSLSAKLLYTAFEKHRVVDPGKRFQSAVKNDKGCQCGSMVFLSLIQSSCYLLATRVNVGRNGTTGGIPANPDL